MSSEHPSIGDRNIVDLYLRYYARYPTVITSKIFNAHWLTHLKFSMLCRLGDLSLLLAFAAPCC